MRKTETSHDRANATTVELGYATAVDATFSWTTLFVQGATPTIYI